MSWTLYVTNLPTHWSSQDCSFFFLRLTGCSRYQEIIGTNNQSNNQSTNQAIDPTNNQSDEQLVSQIAQRSALLYFDDNKHLFTDAHLTIDGLVVDHAINPTTDKDINIHSNGESVNQAIKCHFTKPVEGTTLYIRYKQSNKQSIAANQLLHLIGQSINLSIDQLNLVERESEIALSIKQSNDQSYDQSNGDSYEQSMDDQSPGDLMFIIYNVLLLMDQSSNNQSNNQSMFDLSFKSFKPSKDQSSRKSFKSEHRDHSNRSSSPEQQTDHSTKRGSDNENSPHHNDISQSIDRSIERSTNKSLKRPRDPSFEHPDKSVNEREYDRSIETDQHYQSHDQQYHDPHQSTHHSAHPPADYAMHHGHYPPDHQYDDYPPDQPIDPRYQTYEHHDPRYHHAMYQSTVHSIPPAHRDYPDNQSHEYQRPLHRITNQPLDQPTHQLYDEYGHYDDEYYDHGHDVDPTYHSHHEQVPHSMSSSGSSPHHYADHHHQHNNQYVDQYHSDQHTNVLPLDNPSINPIIHQSIQESINKLTIPICRVSYYPLGTTQSMLAKLFAPYRYESIQEKFHAQPSLASKHKNLSYSFVTFPNVDLALQATNDLNGMAGIHRLREIAASDGVQLDELSISKLGLACQPKRDTVRNPVTAVSINPTHNHSNNQSINQSNNQSVYRVSYYPIGTTKSMLEKLFAPYNYDTIQEKFHADVVQSNNPKTKLNKNPSYCFVTFPNVEYATKAAQELDGMSGIDKLKEIAASEDVTLDESSISSLGLSCQPKRDSGRRSTNKTSLPNPRSHPQSNMSSPHTSHNSPNHQSINQSINQTHSQSFNSTSYRNSTSNQNMSHHSDYPTDQSVRRSSTGGRYDHPIDEPVHHNHNQGHWVDQHDQSGYDAFNHPNYRSIDQPIDQYVEPSRHHSYDQPIDHQHYGNHSYQNQPPRYDRPSVDLVNNQPFNQSINQQSQRGHHQDRRQSKFGRHRL